MAEKVETSPAFQLKNNIPQNTFSLGLAMGRLLCMGGNWSCNQLK